VPLVAMVFGLAAAIGVAMGLASALSSSDVPAVAAVRGDGGGISMGQTSVIRVALVACQIALSILLLVTTGMLRGSLDDALNTDLGFLTRRVAVLAVRTPGGAQDPARALAFQEAVEQSLRKVPQLQSAGWASTPPLRAASRRQFTIEADRRGTTEAAEFDVNVVSTSYFSALNIQRVDGRFFNQDDRKQRAPVVMVDQELATRYLNGRAVGKFLHDAGGTRYEIVGTIVSAKYRTLQEAPQPTVYLPYFSEPVLRPYLFVRTRVDPAAMLPAIQAELARIDPAASVLQAATLQDHVAGALTLDRILTALVGLCGMVALLLASAGVYGVVGDAVRRRSREIAVRVALGADGTRVAGLVGLEVVSATGAGVVLGLAGVFLADRVVRVFVYGVPALDILTIGGTCAILAGVIIAATGPPLYRALRISPSVTLRAN
jgi:predicted permease